METLTESSDEDRIKMTEILLDKLYSLGLSNNEQSLEDFLPCRLNRTDEPMHVPGFLGL